MTNNNESQRDPRAVLETVNDNMMEGLGQLASYFGYNKLMGQLYGALFLSPEALSLDDLTELLSKSKASISMNMRALEQMGVVREVWVRDSRKKFYEAESDLWKALTNVVRQREMRDLQRALEILGDSIEKIKTTRPAMSETQQATADHYVKRIDQLQDFFRLAVAVLNSLMQYGFEFDVNQFTGDSET
jgi:HTH-type transcriptional regulator, glycine betaine synthesis regulator